MGVVIVGVDGSDESRRALRWAAAVAAARGDRVRAIAAWQYPSHAALPFGPTAEGSASEIDRRTEHEVRAVVEEELGEVAADVEIEVVGGRPGDVLVARAARPETEMVVLGARGLGGFDGMLLGSVTQECVEAATCPVVVIRGDAERAAIPPAKVLLGLDGSPGADRALAWTRDLCAATGATVVATTAPGIGASRARAEEAAASLDEWTGTLRDEGLLGSTQVGDGDPRDVLVDLAEGEDVDLVVVGTRGRGRVRSLLLGSVASHLVRQSPRPVAVVPGGDRRG